LTCAQLAEQLGVRDLLLDEAVRKLEERGLVRAAA